jgi:hypothetical protein
MLYEQQNRIYLARYYRALELNMRLLHVSHTGNEMACYTSCLCDWMPFHRPTAILAGFTLSAASTPGPFKVWNMPFSILCYTGIRTCCVVAGRM